MRNTLFLIVTVGFLGVVEARGQNPVSTRTEGTVLLLDNDHAISGKIQRQGNEFRIHRKGGELWLPAEAGMRLCSHWEEALAVMRSRANLIDPDERIRLARWCHLHGLNQQAIQEAQIALQLRPNDYHAEQILKIAKRTIEQSKETKTESASEEPTLPPPNLDLSADSVGMFVTKVQPILMNTCARCHSGDRGGDFKLLRNYGGGTSSQRSTQYNLAAVVRQIQVQKPNLSPLLIKSVSRHGNSTTAPLKSRHAVPFKLLEQWVEQTLQDNPHLRELPELAAQNQAAPPVNQVSFANDQSSPNNTPATLATNPPRILPNLSSAVPLMPKEPQVVPPGPVVVGKPSHSTEGIQPTSAKTPILNPPTSPKPARVISPNPQISPSSNTTPRDEFDPSIFNAQVHPDRK